MPRIINRSTGHEQTVSEKELDVILANPLTNRLYKVIRTKEPVEIKLNKKSRLKREEDSPEIQPEAADEGEQIESVLKP